MCRFEWGRRTTFLGAKENILAAVTPLHGGQLALTALQQGLLGVFPKIVESLTNLGISLWNPGAVVHPGVMYGRCCVDYWDGKPVVDFAAQNNSGKECGDGSRLLHLAACELLLWFPRSYWTDVDASGGHCAAR